MNLSRKKCQVLHLGRNSPTHQCMLRDTHLESNWGENALGFLAEHESVKCPCSKCYWYPGLHYTTYRQQITEVSQSLPSTAETTPEYCFQLWALQCKRDIGVLDKFQKRETKMFKRLEHLIGEEKLKHLGLFSLVKTRLKNKVTNFAKHLKRG